MNKKKVLVIAPFPPPMTGAAYISQEIVKKLVNEADVIEIGLQRGNLQSGSFSIFQSFRILYIGIKILFLRFNSSKIDSVYMVISTSSWGNYRDIYLLSCIGSYLRSKMTIHSHGGNWDIMMNSKLKIIKKINKYLFKGVKNNIILGDYYLKMFNNYFINNSIVQKNFYGRVDELISKSELTRKYNNLYPIRILFLSNLIPEKGYLELLDSFLSLPLAVSQGLQLDFAGTFKYPQDEIYFLNKIKGKSNIFYHGHVSGILKNNLLKKAHLFCLPTKFVYEGQPVTILEAYSQGCIVATTINGGISDIFENAINGLTINFSKKEGSSIELFIDSNNINSILSNLFIFVQYSGFKIGKNNLEYVKKHHDYDAYMKNICSIILNK